MISAHVADFSSSDGLYIFCEEHMIAGQEGVQAQSPEARRFYVDAPFEFKRAYMSFYILKALGI